MDPFEGRLQFLDLLRKLQASQSSQLKTAQFAIRYRDLDEDLFSCILEELESNSNSFNVRVNILYFLETLCDVSKRTGCVTYISMVQRDLRKIVDHVVPPGLQGSANVAQTRHFLRKMQEKTFLLQDEYQDMDRALAARGPVATESESPKLGDGRTITKEDILRRIEEDRERHKRLRESLWVVSSADDGEEFRMAWEQTSDLCEDDYEVMREEMALCRQSQAV